MNEFFFMWVHFLRAKIDWLNQDKISCRRIATNTVTLCMPLSSRAGRVATSGLFRNALFSFECVFQELKVIGQVKKNSLKYTAIW
jgi:hypothetical protein